jgi:hypothetical protein
MKILHATVVATCAAAGFCAGAYGLLSATQMVTKATVTYNDRVAGPFETHESGVVVDTNTGIVWMPEDISLNRVRRDEAEVLCQESEYAGFDDWTLASLADFRSIADYSRAVPATALPNVKSVYYWTSTEYAPSPEDTGWAILGYTMGSFGNSLAHLGYGRCVREHEELPGAMFVDNGDETLTDQSGRKWAAIDPVDAPVSWSDAVGACEASGHSGYTDWKLPSLKDLYATFDHNKENVSLLPNMKDGDYWSSDSLANYPVYGLYVGIDGGNSGPEEKGELKYVRCVR